MCRYMGIQSKKTKGRVDDGGHRDSAQGLSYPGEECKAQDKVALPHRTNGLAWKYQNVFISLEELWTLRSYSKRENTLIRLEKALTLKFRTSRKVWVTPGSTCKWLEPVSLARYKKVNVLFISVSVG